MIEIVIASFSVSISALSLIGLSWWRYRTNYRIEIRSIYKKIEENNKELSNKIDDILRDLATEFIIVRERMVAVERDIKWIKKFMEDKY